MTLTIMLVLFAAFLLMGMPMAFAMGLSSVLAVWQQGQVPLMQLPLRMFSALDSYALMAVLLFILAGNLMNTGGITERIVAFARSLVGHLRGGLAQVNIFTSLLFSSVNGSSMADTAAVGSMMIPQMKKEGYDTRFSATVTAVSALLGPVLPPSIMAIIYATLTGASIGRMFLAGIVPAIILCFAMMVLTWYLAPRYGWKPTQRAPIGEVGRTFVRAGPALLMPVIIVGGIVSGTFTPTEAGAVAVLYGFAAALLARALTIRSFFEFTLNSAKLSASALIIIGGAGLFGWVLTREGLGFVVEDLVMSAGGDVVSATAIILLGLLFIGLFVEGIAAMILVIPILAPIAANLGYDEAQFGVMAILMLLVGAVTPPVGVVAMLASKIARIPYASIFGLLVPYCLLVLGVVVLIALVPGVATWLPDLLNS